MYALTNALLHDCAEKVTVEDLNKSINYGTLLRHSSHKVLTVAARRSLSELVIG